MFRIVWLGLLGLALIVPLSDGARAGAWTLERGTGLAIAEIAGLSADERFDAERAPVAEPDFAKLDGRVLVEYGLTDAVTLRMRGAYENGRQDGFDPSAWRGIALAEVGARLRVLDRGRFVGSIEGALRLAEPASGRPAAEFEARLLGGVSFELLHRSAFVDVQLGYRFRPQARTDEALLALTAGIRPFERTLLLVQSFSTVATTLSDAGLPLHDRHVIQGSVVFDVSRRWSLQLGGGRTVAGSSTLRERSAFASLWLRF